MLAPNPQAETFISQSEETTEANTRFFERFVFVGVAYVAAAAALALPVIVYMFW